MDNEFEQLEEKIRIAKQGKTTNLEEKITPKNSDDSQNGIQAGFELVGSIVVCTVAGYGLDQWLGTKPLCLISLFFLGVFVGFFNVYRVSKNLGATVGYSELHRREKQAKTSPELDKIE